MISAQVRLLVDRHGVSIDTKDVHGRTPLMLSCIIDNDELGYRMAHIFLRAGAYLNLRDSMGRTALTYACMNGRESVVGLLLKVRTILFIFLNSTEAKL